MITVRQEGDFSKLNGFLEKCKEVVKMGDLNKYGEAGVAALKSATPKDTGLTANSWSYRIERKSGSVSIIFENSNLTSFNVPVAVLIQYGHATGNGGYVEGVDYINPALKPVFEKIADEAFKEVSR